MGVAKYTKLRDVYDSKNYSQRNEVLSNALFQEALRILEDEKFPRKDSTSKQQTYIIKRLNEIKKKEAENEKKFGPLRDEFEKLRQEAEKSDNVSKNNTQILKKRSRYNSNKNKETFKFLTENQGNTVFKNRRKEIELLNNTNINENKSANNVDGKENDEKESDNKKNSKEFNINNKISEFSKITEGFDFAIPLTYSNNIKTLKILLESKEFKSCEHGDMKKPIEKFVKGALNEINSFGEYILNWNEKYNIIDDESEYDDKKNNIETIDNEDDIDYEYESIDNSDDDYDDYDDDNDKSLSKILTKNNYKILIPGREEEGSKKIISSDEFAHLEFEYTNADIPEKERIVFDRLCELAPREETYITGKLYYDKKIKDLAEDAIYEINGTNLFEFASLGKEKFKEKFSNKKVPKFPLFKNEQKVRDDILFKEYVLKGIIGMDGEKIIMPDNKELESDKPEENTSTPVANDDQSLDYQNAPYYGQFPFYPGAAYYGQLPFYPMAPFFGGMDMMNNPLLNPMKMMDMMQKMMKDLLDNIGNAFSNRPPQIINNIYNNNNNNFIQNNINIINNYATNGALVNNPVQAKESIQAVKDLGKASEDATENTENIKTSTEQQTDALIEQKEINDEAVSKNEEAQTNSENTEQNNPIEITPEQVSTAKKAEDDTAKMQPKIEKLDKTIDKLVTPINKLITESKKENDKNKKLADDLKKTLANESTKNNTPTEVTTDTLANHIDIVQSKNDIPKESVEVPIKAESSSEKLTDTVINQINVDQSKNDTQNKAIEPLIKTEVPTEKSADRVINQPNVNQSNNTNYYATNKAINLIHSDEKRDVARKENASELEKNPKVLKIDLTTKKITCNGAPYDTRIPKKEKGTIPIGLFKNIKNNFIIADVNPEKVNDNSAFFLTVDEYNNVSKGSNLYLNKISASGDYP